MIKFSKYYLFILIYVFQLNIGKAQSFLNGSFEDNIANNCYYNISNSTFDSLMNHVKGIGNLQGLDIFYNDSCGSVYPAEDGSYFVTLETYLSPSTSTAISLKLDTLLIFGNNYSFEYYDQSGGVPVSIVEIGLSDNDSTFGNLIFTSPPPLGTWTRRIVSFSAPITGKYITARAQMGQTSIHATLIDNFTFDVTGVSIPEIQQKKITEKLFPNPNNGKMQYEYSLQNNSVGSFEMYDPLGRKLISYKLTEGNNLLDINLENISSGLYLYKVIVDNAIVNSDRVAIIK